MTNNSRQRGFSLIVILIAVAVVLVIGAITYGYFIMTGSKIPDEQTQTQTSVTLTQQDPLQSQVGTPECPELDYTGCDNTGDFMTWTDDGVR